MNAEGIPLANAITDHVLDGFTVQLQVIGKHRSVVAVMCACGDHLNRPPGGRVWCCVCGKTFRPNLRKRGLRSS